MNEPYRTKGTSTINTTKHLAIEFYDGRRKTNSGLSLRDILRSTDYQLERSHDWIQWAFPNNQPSDHNADCPVLTELECILFRESIERRELFREMIQRIYQFYGIRYNPLSGQLNRVVERSKGKSLPVWWLAERNHHWLRITRILRSMVLLGYRPEAEMLLAFLRTYGGGVDLVTWSFWTKAVQTNLWAEEAT